MSKTEDVLYTTYHYVIIAMYDVYHGSNVWIVGNLGLE